MYRLLPLAMLLASLQATAADAPPALHFDSAADLSRFLMPSSKESIPDALKALLHLEHAGSLVSAGMKAGPAYAAKVAAQIPSREFQQGYSDLARYLDLFGPCAKQQASGAQGWWSNYPDPPTAQHCSEATKLVAGVMLWNQVHYCAQLVRREVKPRFAEDSDAPRRLDQPPVASTWLNAPNLYAVADAVIEYGFAQAACASEPAERVKDACLSLAAAAAATPPNREMMALEAAKLILRQWEALHLRHLETRAPDGAAVH